jgi:hypothetical protein
MKLKSIPYLLLIVTTLFCCSCDTTISSDRFSLSCKSTKKIPQQILVQMFNLDIYSNALIDRFNNNIFTIASRGEIQAANFVAAYIGKDTLNKSPRTLLSNIHNVSLAQAANLEYMYFLDPTVCGLYFDTLDRERAAKSTNAIVALSHLSALLDAAVESIILNKDLAIQISNAVALDVEYDPNNPNYSVEVDAAVVRQFGTTPNLDTNSVECSDIKFIIDLVDSARFFAKNASFYMRQINSLSDLVVACEQLEYNLEQLSKNLMAL